MNLYIIVEGEQTEMKVYPEWLHFLAPQLEKVDDAWSIKPDSHSYYLFHCCPRKSVNICSNTL